MSDNEEYQPESDVLPDEEQAQVNAEVQQEGWDGVSEPSPSAFADYDEYVRAVVDWRVKQASPGPLPAGDPKTVVGHAVAEGVAYALQRDRTEQAEAQAQAQRDVGPVPDDPKRAERSYWTELSVAAGKAAIKAKEAGDTQKYHEWRQRQRQYENALEELGPTPERQFAEDLSDHFDEKGMGFLMNPKNANDPAWENPRLLNDSSVVVQRQLERARTVVRLPMLDSPHGNPLPCQTANMASFSDLPQDVLQTIRSQVKGASDPDEAIRRAWAVLYQTGYAGTAQPAVKSKKAAPSEDETDPNKMSWQQFVKWREATEAKKRKRAVMFPPRRGGGK